MSDMLVRLYDLPEVAVKLAALAEEGGAEGGKEGRAYGGSRAGGKLWPRKRGRRRHGGKRGQWGAARKGRAKGEAIAPNTPLCFTVVPRRRF